MQRWMLLAILGGVGFVLLGVGAFFGFKEYKSNRPDKIWVPLPLNMELPFEEQKKLATQIEERLRDDELLLGVIKDAGLQQKFKKASEAEALADLKERLFVEVGTAESPVGRVPSVNVGLRGIAREREVLGEASMRLNKDVMRLVGIDPETGKVIQRSEEDLPDSF